MMKELFLAFLNVSINGGILIAAVILTRYLFKKHNRGIICLLWGLVALRMLIPVNIPVELSLLPTAQSVTVEKAVEQTPVTEKESVGKTATGTSVNAGSNIGTVATEGVEVQPPAAVMPYESGREVPPVESKVTSHEKDADVKDIFIRYGTVVWLAGIACMVIYFVICDIRLRRKVRVRYEKEKGVYLCDDVKSPFVMGVIRPRIMLPSSTDEENEQYILMHERAHIERGDHVWKVLAFVVLALHWYNPLVWLSFLLYTRDTELACDERVIRKNGTQIRKAYAHALLTYSMGKGDSVRGGWSFSQRSLTVRIKSVLNYKKPALWVFVSFALVCVVLVVCFMTVPVDGEDGGGDGTPVSATEGTSETESTVPTESTEVTETTESATNNTEPTEPEPTEPYSDYDVIIRNSPFEGIEVECEQYTIWHSTDENYGENLDMLTVPLYYEEHLCLERFGGVKVASSFSELEELLCETTYAIHGKSDYEKECDFYCPQMFQNTMRNNMLNVFTEEFFESNSLIVLYTDQFSRDISVILNGNEISLQYKYFINDNALEYFLENGEFAESDPSDPMPTVEIFPKLEWKLLAVPNEVVEHVDVFSIFASVEPIFID